MPPLAWCTASFRGVWLLSQTGGLLSLLLVCFWMSCNALPFQDLIFISMKWRWEQKWAPEISGEVEMGGWLWRCQQGGPGRWAQEALFLGHLLTVNAVQLARSIHPFPLIHSSVIYYVARFPGGSHGKESACNAGDPGLIPGWERSPGEGHVNPLQYSCLENPMGRVAWWATVHSIAKSRTRLSD